MKILLVNKFHYIVGGSETYYFALKKLLMEHGHTVIEFSMKDDRNLPSDYEDYFVDNVDYNGGMSKLAKVKAAVSIVYSLEAKKKFEQLIKDTRPDLVHLHLFQHQISPSILDVIKKYNIPAVYTAHELKMICPNYKMYTNGRVCEACVGGSYWHCLTSRCVKGSYAKSLINVAEAYVHDWRKSYDAIDRIITPSAFYRRKFLQAHVDADRVVHIPNFLDRARPLVEESEDKNQYFLYLGRLSEEKGLPTLCKAAKRADVTLYILGRGVMEAPIRRFIEKNKANNIKLLGFKSGQELINLVGNAKAVVLPSEWYENGPYSAIEALQVGRPIIGADIAGIPELVDGNGYLFESGNVKELTTCLKRMDALSSEEYGKMEQASYQIYQNNYTSMVHYQKLMEVYESCLR